MSSSSSSWTDYLTEATRRSATSINRAILKRRLENREKRVFLRRGGKVHVRITDLSRSGTVISTVYNDATQLARAVDAGYEDTRMRIISIYSENSIRPLMITSELMCHILRRHKVHPDFLHVLLSFGEEPHVAEAGSSHSSAGSSSSQRKGAPSSHISYQMNYVEENFRDPHNPWSFRHTGVYHQHQHDDHPLQFDLFVLLHPNQSSVLDAQVLEWLGIDPSKTPLATSSSTSDMPDPERLHLLVLSSFLDNWRWYLRYLGERFNDATDAAMTMQPDEADPNESFKRVTELRNVNDWAYQAQACCSNNLDVVRKLKESVDDETNELVSFETALAGYIESCEALLPRIRNTIDLVGYTLTLHNQLETAQVDKELRDLTEKLRNVTNELKDLQQDSVDDSAAVKIITFVSAVYLPGSFVVSLYGMNFFVFDQDARQIVIAKDFWIFLATWLPLTVITGLIYVLIVLFDAWWKGKPFRLFQRPNKGRRHHSSEEAGQNELDVVGKVG
ncbi:hypothetical protein VTN96DRAFT_4843 [Rasamsonia emersonii]